MSFAGILVGLTVLGLMDIGSWQTGQDLRKPPLSHSDMLSTQKSIPKYVWPGKNGDALRTGASEYPLDLSILQSGPAWTFYPPPNTMVRATPVIDDKMNIYLAICLEKPFPYNGTVRKFSPDGKVLWKYVDTSYIPPVPSLYDGALYITNLLGMVTALDMETGDVIWSKSVLVDGATATGGDTWSMTAADGVVISTTQAKSKDIIFNGTVGGNTALVALDAKTGEIKWYFVPDENIYNNLLSIKDGSVVFASCTGQAYRLDLKTGQLIWKTDPGKTSTTSSIIEEAVDADVSTGGAIIGHDGVVYVTSNGKRGGKNCGFVTAFKFSDGTVLWRTPTGIPANVGPAIGEIDGRLALATGIGQNPALADPDLQALGTPDNASVGVYKDSRIVTLDAKTGEWIWTYQLPPWRGWGAGDTPDQQCLPDAFGNPAISHDGTVFIGNLNGRLYGIKDKDGNGQISLGEEANYDMGRCTQSAPAIAPGTLAFSPCDGMIVFKA